VAHGGAGPHDDDAFQDGDAFRDGNAVVRATDGNAVHCYRVRLVHRRAGPYVRAVFREEKNAQGKDGNARKNAHVHAHAPAL